MKFVIKNFEKIGKQFEKRHQKMGFMSKAFQKIKPKRFSKKEVAENSPEVQSDGEEGSILSVALEEQISQILDVDEDNDSNDPNEVFSDGDNKIRKNQKGAMRKNRKNSRKDRNKDDISIAMSGVSLIFW